MDCPLYDEYATVRRGITLLPDEVHKIQAGSRIEMKEIEGFGGNYECFERNGKKKTCKFQKLLVDVYGKT